MKQLNLVIITLFTLPLWAQFQDLAVETIAQRNEIPIEQLTIVNQAEVGLDHLDQTLFTYKLVDLEQGTAFDICFDSLGQERNKADTLASDQEAARQFYGNLDPALYDYLLEAPGDELVRLAIWLEDRDEGYPIHDLPQGEPNEEELNAVMADVVARRADYVSSTLANLVEELQGMGFDPTAAQFAPVVFAQVPADMVWLVANLGEVERVYQQRRYLNRMSKARRSLYAHNVNGRNASGTFWGNTGKDIKVAVIEAGGRVPTNHNKLGSYVYDFKNVCSQQSSHATHVMGIIQGRDASDYGIAPHAFVRIAGGCDETAANHDHGLWDKDLVSATDRAVNWGATVFNYSLGDDRGGRYDSLTRYFDNLSKNIWRTFVCAAGNDGDKAKHRVDNPGAAFNVITVGNYDDKRTQSRSDDVMSSSSSYKNPVTRHNDHQKPEIAAPGAWIRSAYVSGMGTMSGTSMSTPMATGTIALMQKANYWISLQPESSKAILMATAINNIEGTAARSDKDGAGGMDTEEAVEIAKDHSYYGRAKSWHTRSYACWAQGQFPMTYTEELQAGKKTRIAIAWSVLEQSGQPSMDYDLQIIRPDGRYLTGSYSWDSASEIVEFTAPVSGEYRIRITSYRCDEYTQAVSMAYAMWQP